MFYLYMCVCVSACAMDGVIRMPSFLHAKRQAVRVLMRGYGYKAFPPHSGTAPHQPTDQPTTAPSPPHIAPPPPKFKKK